MNLKWGNPSTIREGYPFAIVLLSVLLYQLMVYYNCKNDESNPKSIKYLLGNW
jgi:hypothetical protein